MIIRTFTAKTAAIALALAIHGAAMMQFSPNMTVQIDSGAGAAQAVIGSSFEDMSVGTLAATQTEDVIEAVAPEPDMAQPPEPTPLETPNSEVLALTPTVTETKPPAPQALAPPKTEILKPIKQAETVQAEQPKPEQTVKATKPTKPKNKPAQPKAKAAPKGNAKQNNTKGSATGTQEAKAKVQGTKAGKATTSGTAAASNYPGKVMHKISRVSRPRSSTRGSVVVAFTIASSGGLSGLSVAKTSGNAKLDQLALSVIRKAAPFPKPPAGARRSFSITIKGR